MSADAAPTLAPSPRRLGSARSWVERRQLPVFFVLACALSWTTWTIADAIRPVSSIWAAALDLLATFGPALSALALVALAGSRPGAPVRSRSLRIAAVAAVAVAAGWTLWSRWSDEPLDLQVAAVLTVLVLAVLPPLVVWRTWQLRPHDAEKPSRRTSARTAWWTVLAVTLFPLIGLAGWMLATGATSPAFPREDDQHVILLVLTTFVATALYGGPLGEEIGWRGYALPRLEARWSPLGSAVVLGVAWGVWHVPLHLRGDYDASMGPGASGLILRVVSQVGLAIIFTWFYHHTGESLLVMVLMHTTLNNSAGYWLPQTPMTFSITAVVVVLICFAPSMRRRAASSSQPIC